MRWLGASLRDASISGIYRSPGDIAVRSGKATIADDSSVRPTELIGQLTVAAAVIQHHVRHFPMPLSTLSPGSVTPRHLRTSLSLRFRQHNRELVPFQLIEGGTARSGSADSRVSRPPSPAQRWPRTHQSRPSGCCAAPPTAIRFHAPDGQIPALIVESNRRAAVVPRLTTLAQRTIPAYTPSTESCRSGGDYFVRGGVHVERPIRPKGSGGPDPRGGNCSSGIAPGRSTGGPGSPLRSG